MRKEDILVRMPLEVLNNKFYYLTYNSKFRELLSHWLNHFNKVPEAQFLCPAILGIDLISKLVAKHRKKFPEFPQQTSLYVSLTRIWSLVSFQTEQ